MNDSAARSVTTGDVKILFRYGDGSFGAPIRFFTGFHAEPRGVVAIDLNGDSNLDIIITNADADNISVFFGYGNGTFRSFTILSNEVTWPVLVAVENLNCDGYLDIVVVNYVHNHICILPGHNGKSFERELICPLLGHRL